MQVNLYATFRLLAGVKSFSLDLPDGVNVTQAIQEIVHCHPVLRTHWLGEDGTLHAHVHVFVNGEDAATLPEGLDTKLHQEDTLDFFPPVAGGAH
jgi:molybdopterin synthase sulfur carrier subunit